MNTEILPINSKNIEFACNLLRSGEIVAIPTETVYGLAGDATNPNAINKIFEAKGRPQDNPLIVHISNMNMLKGIVREVNKDAEILAKAFWPGPLTIIMPKGKDVCDEVTAGLDSVGVRMPAHSVARKIIEQSNTPFAAPSANISGKPSPTTAEDVYIDMNGRIPAIIDGGQCEAGIESTVISVLQETPIILRPGVITKEDIEKILNKKVEIAKAVTDDIVNNEEILSPGMKYKHYSPKAEIILIRGSLNNFIKYVDKNTNHKDTYIMCFDNEEKFFTIPCITYGKIDNPKEQANKLFSTLRKLDKLGAQIVYARCPESEGIALAVYNRLIRSAGFKIITLE